MAGGKGGRGKGKTAAAARPVRQFAHSPSLVRPSLLTMDGAVFIPRMRNTADSSLTSGVLPSPISDAVGFFVPVVDVAVAAPSSRSSVCSYIPY